MSTEKTDILRVVQQAFPKAVDISVDATIVQTNAVGYKASIRYEAGSHPGSFPESVFLKKVMVQDYVGDRKDWSDLRRTLLYARTETRFYRDFLPTLEAAGVSGVPKTYLAKIDLEGLIPDSEPIVAGDGMTTHDLPKLTKEQTDGKGSWIVLECISDATHFQDSPLTKIQCQQCLEAAASLHASAWNKKALLESAQKRLSSGPVFALATRNPKELEGICDAWEHFTTEFQEDLKDLLVDPKFRELGSRCQKLARYLADEMSVSCDHPHATLIHGDYKAMNLFLPKEGSSGEPIFIDFASIGVGLGMADVAMHIRHAVRPEQLVDCGEEAFVKYYYDCLTNKLPEGAVYSWKAAQREYMYASVDYFRFFLGRMWRTATHESMSNKANNPNIHLVNRNVDAAVAYCERIDSYLRIIESEYAETVQ